ncbi:MAG: cation-translocating P-type ATPase [Methanobrevibacter ruminantium]|uniref:heavy metal translocating P-type ATPase n=1 Tax=Methanobrevibacter ruminantium TaxID=83816 RepID=UPI0026F189AD|nr:cation-translocating P-type ATPase [Methanobrevibacter ruminantium]MCI5737237.1 cation-translocating P-type ATPase [Methanobrevibacter ruminantium]MDO5842653.1 cation-translocating P-type ATPase [Methanobrevibacter ruminantium]
MIDEITDFLFGLKMTIISAIFLVIAVIFMILGIDTPIYLNPAWGAVIISGIPMLLLALTRLIREKWISSALLIAIAMVASLLIGEIFAAGEVAWIMALGALLEDWTVERAKKGLRNLINLTPQTGRRIVDGKEEMISVDEIKIGDTLRILPGESVPVDGEIINGTSSLDQSIMTGESLPIDKDVGDEVFCGTMNLYGAIDIKATSLGENSSLQKLIDLVKAADEKQAPTQRIADKWATWLVPVALIIAIAAWLITGNIERGVTVLVVFCPCALILATPTAIMAAIGQATKYGVLIKSGEALETLGGLNTLVFDKTGTLTYGNLAVSDIISLKDDLDEMDVLNIVASCEELSEHPLAKAVVDKAKEVEIDIEEPQDFKMFPGKGVSCKNSYGQVYAGNSKFLSGNNIDFNVDSELNQLKHEGKASIIVALNDGVVGLIGLSDVIREDSKNMIENLHELGTETILLTGDNTETANYFASQVGIGKVYGNLLPQEKLDWIEKLKSEGKKVCMIGDGVNDAPALKTADVSVAMGSVGSDVAIEAADIALLGDDIGKIPYLKKLSNSTLFTIKANIILSMTINAVAIVCSVLGLLNPVTGAIVHNAGSCLVVLNAALLYDRKFDDSIKKIDTENVEHSHYHFHNDGEHSHSHDGIKIIDEIETESGIKHMHAHKHALSRQSCGTYHN